MNALLKKMNFKTQESIVVLNAPELYPEIMRDFEAFLSVKSELCDGPIEFVLTFCTKLEEVKRFAQQIDQNLVTDGLLWFAYPKGSSKRYSCEFNRDNGWHALGDLGYEPVRMVAIDEDWSALRFRKAKNIKKLTRNEGMILSKEGMDKLNKK
ncbi:hypothetical protein [Jiulongibacter sp. NS-SX5]|uniref:hypothetical protein n=1 Tax=Jiulongibacter sp. NS-SX5 TaxID=3463854 RepID=UPI004057FD0D